MKGFKYQITVTVLLSKHKINGDIEYAPVYFNWINEGSRSIEAQYVNISVYSPLIGSTYIELPSRLKHLKKGLIINVFFGVISDI